MIINNMTNTTSSNPNNKTTAINGVSTIADISINVLGTNYTIKHIKHNSNEYMIENNLSGYCDYVNQTIYIDDINSDKEFDKYSISEKAEFMKTTVRHELIHAFLYESGLSSCALKYDYSWAKNEEMVDWFAMQIPKIYKIFEQVGCI